MLGVKIKLAKDSAVPISRQLARQLSESIIRGELRSGAKLPSHRQLARILGVSRSVVVKAYRELEYDELVDSISGSGTYVSAGRESDENRFDAVAWTSRLRNLESHSVRKQGYGQFSESLSSKKLIRFDSAAPRAPDLPAGFMEQILQGLGGSEFTDIMNYSHPRGLKQLLKILAVRMRQSGQRLSTLNFMITNGAQQAIHMLFSALSSPEDRVVIEEPTYYHVINLAKMMKLRVSAIRRTREGINTAELEEILKRSEVKFIYTMSCSHNPTGFNMPEHRKEILVRLAENYRVPLIDDTVFSELQYERTHPTTLRSFDREGCVIEIGSISKTFAPGLRVGWIVAPRSLIERLSVLVKLSIICVPGINQLIAARFLSTGAYDEHRDQLIRRCSQKRKLMEQACNEHLPTFIKYSAPDGGYFFWLEFPEGFDTDQICSISEKKGVVVAPGRLSFFSDDEKRNIRLSFASAEEDQIEPGVIAFSESVKSYVKENRDILKNPDYSLI